jgi:hypothetical protein
MESGTKKIQKFSVVSKIIDCFASLAMRTLIITTPNCHCEERCRVTSKYLPQRKPRVLTRGAGFTVESPFALSYLAHLLEDSLKKILEDISGLFSEEG